MNTTDRIDITALSQEELLISDRLRKMRMSGMADAFEAQVQDPNADLSSFMDRFTALVEAEWQLRYNKKLKRFLKNAHLRYPMADLDETIYDPARKLDTATIEKLATCEWIEEGKNLLITGMTSSGKTYLGNALCVCALRQFKSVCYFRTNMLILQMGQAQMQSTYLDLLGRLCKVDLLVIDDFGLMELDIEKCRNLFDLIDAREGRKSTLVISQFPVKSWFEFFKDHTYADAFMARLTDRRNSYRIEMNGISMRDK